MAIKISNFHHISILYLTVFDANTANTRLKYKCEYKYATLKILRYKYKYKYQFLCICKYNYKYKYVFDHIPGYDSEVNVKNLPKTGLMTES